MKFTLIRSLIAAMIIGPAAYAAGSGTVDFGSFAPAAGKEYVEINLKPALIKFAAKIVAKDDPEAAELLRNIDGVRVHVVGLDESNRATTVTRMNEIRSALAGSGWEQMVTVKQTDEKGGDDVAIFVKTADDEAIAGVVVTVLSNKGEAVLVNIAGNIRAEQIVTVAEKFDIKPLRELKLKAESAKPDRAA